MKLLLNLRVLICLNPCVVALFSTQLFAETADVFKARIFQQVVKHERFGLGAYVNLANKKWKLSGCNENAAWVPQKNTYMLSVLLEAEIRKLPLDLRIDNSYKHGPFCELTSIYISR